MKPFLYLLSIFLLMSANAQQERESVTLDTVAQEAKALAEKPLRELPGLPSELEALTYDQYRSIRFRPSEALWWNANSLFRVEFFHPGHIFNTQVSLFEVSDTHVQKIPFLKDAFDYGESGYNPGFFDTPKGYSGIRIKYPLNNEKTFDELVVFQGASYFRALGVGHTFGLSLRGLAMDSAGEQEDFPHFTKLWMKKPADGAKSLTVFALLEGDQVTGAYRFDIEPKGVTVIKVRARLYFRGDGAAEVGVAPLTSMFVHGENSLRPIVDDWRPEVHDSDGLLVHADSMWDWFPLENLPGRNVRRLPMAKLQGFGLLQRDRDFRNYKDLEAHYEQRPSAWIEPIGKWPTGEIVLYTFGTETEATDNVTAYWRPDLPEGTTGPVEFAYTITIQSKDPIYDLAKVMETRVGRRTMDADSTTVVIEFSRPETLSQDQIKGLSVGFDYGSAEMLEEPVIQYNAPEDRIRVFAHFRTPAGGEIDAPYRMSAQLFREGHQVSERWNYTWKP